MYINQIYQIFEKSDISYEKFAIVFLKISIKKILLSTIRRSKPKF